MKKNKEPILPSDFAVPYYEIPYDRFFQFGHSVDCVIFGFQQGVLKVLLIKRGAPPFLGKWALPGDLVYPNEPIDTAAERILFDLTGVDGLFLSQTKTYGEVDRHPVGRVVTTAYFSLIDISKHESHASGWADGIKWVDIEKIQSLAFDHLNILKDALRILKAQIKREPIAFKLLPEKFTLGELQDFYEALLGQSFDKANFRKKFLSLNVLNDTQEVQQDVPHRPGKLFKFDSKKIKTNDFAFEI